MDNPPITKAEAARKIAQDNYKSAAEFLANFDRHKNGRRKYDTPEEFKAMRKLYKRAHGLIWAQDNKPWQKEGDYRKKYRLIRNRRPVEMKAFYLEIETADGLPCFYCSIITNLGTRTVDHKTPISRGGEHVLENVCCACRSCNSSKGKLTAEEFLVLLRPTSGQGPELAGESKVVTLSA